MDCQTDRRTAKRMDGRTHDGHNAMTIARWPLASGAKKNEELKQMINVTKQLICFPKGRKFVKQEGQDGPGSLTGFFEFALAIFFFCRFQRRIYKNFFMSVQCKKPPFINAMFIDRSKFQEQL